MTKEFFVAMTAALALAGCGNGADPDSDTSAATVRVAVVEQVPASESLRAVGLLAPADEVRLAFTTGGVIRSMAVEQGAEVRKAPRDPCGRRSRCRGGAGASGRGAGGTRPRARQGAARR
jgi:hypothetical protein